MNKGERRSLIVDARDDLQWIGRLLDGRVYKADEAKVQAHLETAIDRLYRTVKILKTSHESGQLR